jgi:hypothetical protein
MAKYTPVTFQQLVDEYANFIMMRLIERGGVGFKGAVSLAMQGAISWYKEQEMLKKEKEDRKRKRDDAR